MNAVDSALDPLVFGYVSCGVSDIVNNLWTWVAVLTAAVSFWSFRTAAAGEALRLTLQVPAPGFVVLHRKARSDRYLNSESSVVDDVRTETTPVISTPKTPASSPIVCDDEEVVTKGKFVAYYREEAAEEEKMDDAVECNSNGDVDGAGNGWWETELRVRMGGELGWYRYQDLTAINGNVVRLWDGVRSNSNCNPRRCC